MKRDQSIIITEQENAKNNQTYKLFIKEQHQLFFGDSLEVLSKAIPDRSRRGNY